MRAAIVLAALAALPVAAGSMHAQTARAQAFSIFSDDADRPRLGVSTRTTGLRDTLGLLVEAVTDGSPAEKAGIEEGDRLQSIDGVNLKLSRDDAEDDGLEGIATRRLTRQLGKHKAGDEVDIRLYRDGQTKSVRAKLVSADDLYPRSTLQGIRTSINNRAVLGISFGGSGSKRDTLGILVVGVNDSGPAAKAGIEEGDRIQSINGVDLRVDREDAGDWEATSSRIRRVNRAMEKAKPGDDVELRVYAQGQSRTIHAKAAKASDLSRDVGGFFMKDGGVIDGIIRRMPMPSVAPRPTPAPAVRALPRRVIISDEARPTILATPALAERIATTIAPTVAVTARAATEAALARTTVALASTRAMQERAFSRAMIAPRGVYSSVGRGMLGVPGLTLMPVNDDLASYLGAGSERGVLVVEVSNGWRGLHDGDVILSIDGRAVRGRDGSTSIVFPDGRSRSEIELLRGGRRMHVVVER